ncbi:MAG: ABC transporter substrate-binding protein [Phycisphaerales bacterium]|nr:ABC transporter substrate-binding protein [Phycisphaerales bacterium]
MARLTFRRLTFAAASLALAAFALPAWRAAEGGANTPPAAAISPEATVTTNYPAESTLAPGRAAGAADRAAEASILQPSARKLRIGISIPAADHGWTAGVVWWAKQAQALYPEVDFTLATAGTPQKQISDIESMMVKGIDGLVVLATESAPLTPIAKQAHEKGIYLVNVDRGFLEPVADVFLEGDNKAFGRKSAEYMVQRLGGEGKIVILEGIPCTVNTDRVEAALEVFKQHPGIEILGRQPAHWNRQKGLEVMQTFLVKHKQIDAVWAQDDDIALGAFKAIREAGREKEMWMLGGAGMKDVVKMVMDKHPMFPANITYPPSMIATGIHLCVSNLRDGNRAKVSQFMPRHLMIDVELITPENAKEYYFPDSVY